MWIEIFKSGRHSDSSGNSSNFSNEDIQLIADKYNEEISKGENYSAPLVKGHPESDTPAHGWVERLARRRDTLYAKLTGITEDITKEIEKGAFRKVSIALYPNKLLKHIGLLGAAQPAVKGLKDVAFTEDKSNSEFETVINQLKSENNGLKEQIVDLEKADRKKKHIDFAERMIKVKNVITPAIKDNLLELLEKSSEISNQDSPLDEMIMTFVEELTPHELNERISEISIELPGNDFTGNVDEKRLEIHNEALKILRHSPEMNYEEAALKAFSEFTYETK